MQGSGSGSTTSVSRTAATRRFSCEPDIGGSPTPAGIAGHAGFLHDHVDGEGVVGEQPLLRPGESHDYVSGCPLATPHGSMEGFYVFHREDGTPLEVRIPFFPLAAPETAER